MVCFYYFKSDQGMFGMLCFFESLCFSCNLGIVKKFGRKFMLKFMKMFGLRSKSFKFFVEDFMRFFKVFLFI